MVKNADDIQSNNKIQLLSFERFYQTEAEINYNFIWFTVCVCVERFSQFHCNSFKGEEKIGFPFNCFFFLCEHIIKGDKSVNYYKL